MRRNRSAFTVIELLVIIIILGVMVTIIAPMVTAGGDVARVRSATRGMTQLSRYARTMALSHGYALELSIHENGKISIAPEGGRGGGESIVSARSFATTNVVGEAEAARLAEFDTAHDASGGGGGPPSMADVNVDKVYEQIRFIFLGYTDTADAGRYSHLPASGGASAIDDEEDEDGENVRVVRVRYQSNGRVRPYRVKVTGEGDDAFALIVAVDMLGSVKVEEDEEDRR